MANNSWKLQLTVVDPQAGLIQDNRWQFLWHDCQRRGRWQGDGVQGDAQRAQETIAVFLSRPIHLPGSPIAFFDGANPQAGLIQDKDGNFYGTTYSGGAYDKGTVFRLTPQSDGTLKATALYSFGATVATTAPIRRPA